MPILANAKKAHRASCRKASYNQRVKSQAKTMINQMKAKPSLENLAQVYSAIDRAVKRRIFHKNKAARLKSRMSKLLAETKSQAKSA